MVDLSEFSSELARRIYAHYERAAEDWRRPHLGASLIGHHCSRFLWYAYRWAQPRSFEGRMLRLFETGDLEEERVAENLRAIGVVLETVDPETGEQWSFGWEHGHFGGSCDGLIRSGFPGAEKSLHLFECKTANTKWYKTIVRDGVKKAKPEHYAQMQAYMLGFHERGLPVKRAAYIVVCKETDDIHVERVHYKPQEAEAIVRKARAVIASPEPLTRISDDPTWYQCRLCDFRPICHLERVEELARNCRTCNESTALDDGSWFCNLFQKRLSVEDQREGCEKHLFIPSLLPWEATDADEVNRAVYYRDRNGVNIVDSARRLTIQEEG